MKRILVIFLVFSIAFSLAACGDPEATGPVPSNTQTAPTQTNSTDASIPESTSTATKPSETEPPVTQPPVTQPPVTQPPVTEPPAPTACSHTAGDWKTDKAATCTTEGSKHKECTKCSTVLETASIAATGHTEAIIPGKAPTTTETGLTEGKVCSVCGTVLLEQQTIPVIPSVTAVVDWNEQDYWSITNVTSQGVYLMGESLPMRVYYVTGPCRVTLLTNLDDPSQWGYTGAYLGITDDGWNVKYDYAALKEHGAVQYYTDSYGDTWFAAGTYYDLPTGTWYFGNVEASSSFFVVVNNPTAEANGTLG